MLALNDWSACPAATARGPRVTMRLALLVGGAKPGMGSSEAVRERGTSLTPRPPEWARTWQEGMATNHSRPRVEDFSQAVSGCSHKGSENWRKMISTSEDWMYEDVTT